MCDDSHFYVNPTGRFVIGGPDGDAGLTGRKIIVDTYGGAAPHGGGAFSGKDPTQGRSLGGLCRPLSGEERRRRRTGRPLHHPAVVCDRRVASAVGLRRYARHRPGRRRATVDVLQQMMDLSPRGIRKHLQLNRPIYARTAAYGHFGREPEPDGGFSWELTEPRRGPAERVRRLGERRRLNGTATPAPTGLCYGRQAAAGHCAARADARWPSCLPERRPVAAGRTAGDSIRTRCFGAAVCRRLAGDRLRRGRASGRPGSGSSRRRLHRLRTIHRRRRRAARASADSSVSSASRVFPDDARPAAEPPARRPA